MPLTVCTSTIHHGHPVMHDDAEVCPICCLVDDLRADVARYRDRCDAYAATLDGIRALLTRDDIAPPVSGILTATLSIVPATDPTPEPAPTEPEYPPAAESKAKAAAILERLPDDTRNALYQAAGIDPSKGVSSWRGRPQAAYELLVACEQAEDAWFIGSDPHAPDDDDEPVGTNGDEAEDVEEPIPEPQPDPEQVRARFAELRAIPKYATIRDLAAKATGQSIAITTSAPDCRAMIMAHEFGESWEAMLDEKPPEVQADPVAITDDDNEVPF